MKFALIGYGKMGKTIEQVIKDQNKGDEIVLTIGEDNLHELTLGNLRKADVAIEFTRPDAAISNINLCFDAGIPVVVGTTAWLDKLDEVKKVCAEKTAHYSTHPISPSGSISSLRSIASWQSS